MSGSAKDKDGVKAQTEGERRVSDRDVALSGNNKSCSVEVDVTEVSIGYCETERSCFYLNEIREGDCGVLDSNSINDDCLSSSVGEITLKKRRRREPMIQERLRKMLGHLEHVLS